MLALPTGLKPVNSIANANCSLASLRRSAAPVFQQNRINLTSKDTSQAVVGRIALKMNELDSLNNSQ